MTLARRGPAVGIPATTHDVEPADAPGKEVADRGEAGGVGPVGQGGLVRCHGSRRCLYPWYFRSRTRGRPVLGGNGEESTALTVSTSRPSGRRHYGSWASGRGVWAWPRSRRADGVRGHGIRGADTADVAQDEIAPPLKARLEGLRKTFREHWRERGCLSRSKALAV